MVDANLEFALKRISRIADLEELLRRNIGAEDVFNSYAEDDSLYQKIIPVARPMHISLKDNGPLGRHGYLGQARLIEDAIEETNARHALELCCGRGYNLIYLAKQNAHVQFDGVDLVPAHIRTSIKRSRLLKNIRYRVGNIEALEYPSGSFDVVFCIESFFHVSDLPKTLSEAYRVLKPGGRLAIIDFFRKRELEAVKPLQRNAMRISENAFAITSPMSTEGFVEAAQKAGFTAFDVTELSNRALPHLRRVHRQIGLFFLIPPVARILTRFFPSGLIDVIVGWELMADLFQSDLMGYFHIEFSRQ